MKKAASKYQHLADIVRDMADVFRPPERLTVAQSAEKYRYLNNTGAYVGPWKNETAPYLVEVMECFTDRRFNSVIFAAPAQTGKPLALSTPLATQDGWTTMGDVKVGDVVFDNKGRPTTVTYVTEIFENRDCYEITFDDGSTIVADSIHRWAVADMYAHDVRALNVRTTAELADSYKVTRPSGKTRFRYSIPVTEPLELPQRDLPLDPYVLGVYIGDGSKCHGQITLNPEDSEHIVERIKARGYGVLLRKEQGNSQGTADNVCLFQDDKTLRSPLVATLEGGQKHIPAEYMRASISQRRELLRGIMDTDGTATSNGRCQISQSNAVLMGQIHELLVSLGHKPMADTQQPFYTHKGERRAGKMTYRLSFCSYDAENVFSLPRHIDRIKQHQTSKTARPTHAKRRFIRDIRRCPSVPVRCISVDNESHLFLCGDAMIPTHNTDILLNWLTHSVLCDPMDMILYQTSQSMARDFSIRRVDRLHRDTPEVGRKILGANGDNTMDKHYTNMLFTMSWPSINELSGRPIGRVFLTDYDRMPQNVDGEGSPFSLSRKRTTTFRSAGKTVAESSPGFAVSDTKWLRRTAHEAPPCEGILSLYNQGDRRRWYWKCPHCSDWFEPTFELLNWPSCDDIMEAAERSMMMCPHCKALIGTEHKYTLNIGGRWVKEGQRLTSDDQLIGQAIRSDMASFWLKGTAAAFAPWRDLVSRYLKAEEEFARTGSQEALKATVNTDQGEPYYTRGSEKERLPEDLKDTALPLDDDKTVPEDVRFLLACADVQKNRFCVQVFGVAPAANGFDVICIDRIDIVKSKRVDEDGERLWVKPASFVEDWWLLKEQVLDKTYTLADGSGVMGIKMMACDSGGRDGVTANAYSFWKQLRDKPQGEGAHKRFMLIKGDNNPSAPRVRVSYPDSSTKDRKAGARGEIPVLMLNGNILKDKLNGMLDVGRGSGGFLFADYLPDEVFVEMTVERRTPKGWEKPKGSRIRNEAWDLGAYALALCAHLRVEYISWEKPPIWAAPWPQNALVVPKETKNPAAEFAQRQKPVYDLAKLAEALA